MADTGGADALHTARTERAPSLVVVSRSMPPDTGGYQRQFTLLAPHLRKRFRAVCWIGAIRDKPLARPGRSDGIDHTIRIPAHRLPRIARGGADVAVVISSLLVMLGHRMARRPSRLLLLSPTMLGAPVLVRAARLLGTPAIARYPTAGDAQHPRGARVGRARGVTAVAPSPGQVDEQMRFPIVLLPNAVAVPPRPHASPRGQGTFLYVGRLIARKRVDLLIQAWREVAGALPDWELAVVGDGGSERDSVEDELQQLVQAGDLPRCRLLGRMADARAFFESADVLVFPSDREGLPNSVLEALAAGVPVLAHPERAAEWFRVPPPMLDWSGEPADLPQAMVRAAVDRRRRMEVGEAGRAFVESHHAAEVVAEALAALA